MTAVSERYCALGVPFVLQAPEPFASVLAEALSDLVDQHPDPAVRSRTLQIEDRGAGFFDTAWDGEPDAEAIDAPSALYQSLIMVNQVAAAHAARTDTVLHAGVVERDGRAIALVGHSGAGKSTLTAGAALAGWGYVADEIAAITPDGHVRPFHRPIGLRSGGAALLGVTLPESPLHHYVHPVAMGGRARLATQASIVAVALVHRRPGAVDRTAVDAPTALVRLADQTLGATDVEAVMFRRLEVLVRSIPIVRLAYESVTDALPMLDALVDEVAPR